MSLVKKHGISFNEVSCFLAEHPDFFIQYPGLLQHLAIPHISGHNIRSLLEYQVTSLQNVNLHLEKENSFLKKDLENQREFTAEIHAFIPHIVEAASLDDLYAQFFECMKKYYLANRVMILLFDEQDALSCHEDIRFIGANDKLRFMFTEIFHRKKPLCNSLQEEHIEALFRRNTADIKSTVLLPVTNDNFLSLIILGSKNTNCYRHGFELDMLVFISQVVGHRFTALLK